EVLDAEVLFIFVEELDDLGPGEEATGRLGAAARRYRLFPLGIVGLIEIGAVNLGMAHAGHGLHLLVRNERRQPILVREAKPAARPGEGLRRAALQIRIAEFVAERSVVQDTVEDADRSLVKNVVAGNRDLTETGDAAEG